MNTLSSLLLFIGHRINFDFYYPVGTYYETSDLSFDPNTAWGGTWALDSAGRVTVARNASETEFNTIGKTGGSKYVQAHTHGFTNPTMPNHVHGMSHGHNLSGLTKDAGSGSAKWSLHASGGESWSNMVVNYSGNTGNPTWLPACTGGAVGAVSGATTGSSGNLQPYVVVNRWHRTA